MGLEINREKTRITKLKEGEALDFLGFTFQFHRDLRGRGHRYLNVSPSRKALAKEREALRDLTDSRQCFKPISDLIHDVNRQLRGWAEYFRYGYPKMVFRKINWYVQGRLQKHLRRRSQRPYRLPDEVTFYRHLADLGLLHLRG